MKIKSIQIVKIELKFISGILAGLLNLYKRIKVMAVDED